MSFAKPGTGQCGVLSAGSHIVICSCGFLGLNVLFRESVWTYHTQEPSPCLVLGSSWAGQTRGESVRNHEA